MTIQLQAENRRVLNITDSVYAHAAILHTISEANAELGGTLHDMRRHKRMTLALVDSHHQTSTLRLTFMAQDGLAYAQTLVNMLSVRPVLQLGKTTCQVGTVDLTTEWAGVSTWADLTSETSGRHIRFDFASPTAITKCDEKGGRFTSLYPEPQDVFSGLAKRWQALQGPALPGELIRFLQTGGCVISNYRLHTIKFVTPERTQIGFTGWVVYECRKNEPAHVAALNALARLAFFTGIGYQTARGMGAVKTSLVE